MSDNKLKEPTREQFGWSEAQQAWTVEGGEQAYYNAMHDFEEAEFNRINDEMNNEPRV